jgi:hypothetical protein
MDGGGLATKGMGWDGGLYWAAGGKGGSAPLLAF